MINSLTKFKNSSKSDNISGKAEWRNSDLGDRSEKIISELRIEIIEKKYKSLRQGGYRIKCLTTYN